MSAHLTAALAADWNLNGGYGHQPITTPPPQPPAPPKEDPK